ncbi:Histone-lysine N-methyltransferase NSD2 [Araneus ventricosus]|uniref:Histone-lysine N-methyltransferase NSD2 n=1 Tax=Araneus ventricosus TaxID=182803 RepID=A0A4Y2R0X9_ARAVE|nr:Histone-lysine N-methyltransferase NSD2 [Araneus ventricosus]GBN69248.1 Histone-lysine N-methyltransferase NSD2 [Araneus ventricosus]
MSLSVGKRKLEENCDEGSSESKRICSNSGEENSSNGLSSDADLSEDNFDHREGTDFIEVRLDKLLGNASSEDNDSSQDKSACFSCKSEVGDVTKCSVESCDKYYHIKCLKKLPSIKGEKKACPLHLCLSCYFINPKNSQNTKGEMYKCSQCPTAFHTKVKCFVPGAVILHNSAITCHTHFTPEDLRGYPRVVNLCFCLHCGCNDDLIFCSSCPCAVHEKCLKTKTFTGDIFVCDRCESRKTVSYNDIVWAKVYNIRWWPAKVLNPKDVPASVRKMQHFDGEFPVQFFETNEYYWTQSGHVHPFIFKEVGIEDKDLMLNFKKTISDPLFDSAVKLACKALTDKRSTDATETSSRRKYPSYKHIKSNRPVGDVQLYTSHDISDYNPCGCKALDPDPCGYDSLCLNRSMCTECSAEVCEAGDRCQNQKFQRLQYAKVKPFWTSTKAWGLKSLEEIKQGHFVIEYCGDLIDEEECERRIREKQEIGDTNFYFCTLDSNRIIDAGPKGNYSRFLNHSCEPNCETQKWIVNGDARVGIFAKKDIPAGSELTFDYQMDFSHYKKLECNCGSKRCSGLIGQKPQNGVVQAAGDVESSEPPSPPSDSKTSKNSTKKNGSVGKTSLKANGMNKLSKVKKEVTTAENSLNKEVSLKKEPVKKMNDHKKDKILCFKCKTGGKLLHCSLQECGRSFHVRCLKPGMETFQSDDWECPSHFCQKCKMLSPYQCFACPNSYCFKHVTNIPKSGKFACPKHFNKKQ